MNGGQGADGGIDMISLRLVVGGLVSGLIMSIVAMWSLTLYGLEVPPGLAVMAGTLAGSLASLLVRPTARSEGRPSVTDNGRSPYL